MTWDLRILMNWMSEYIIWWRHLLPQAMYSLNMNISRSQWIQEKSHTRQAPQESQELPKQSPETSRKSISWKCITQPELSFPPPAAPEPAWSTSSALCSQLSPEQSFWWRDGPEELADEKTRKSVSDEKRQKSITDEETRKTAWWENAQERYNRT